MTELALIAAIGALGVAAAAILARWLLAHGVAPSMLRAAEAIGEGAAALLRQQTRGAASASALLGAAVFVVYAFARARSGAETEGLAAGAWAAAAFAVGAFASLAAGYLGSWVSLRSAVRLATVLAAERAPRVRPDAAAPHPLNTALQLALRGGAVMGVATVTVSLLATTLVFALLALLGAPALARLPVAVAGFGFGSSLVAVYLHVGGGVFATAADSAAAVDHGDDGLRNPATVARAVGDHARDWTARAGDLLETASAEMIGVLVLAEAVHPASGASALGFFVFPLAARAFGILATIVGVISVTTDGLEDPMHAVHRGLFVTAMLACLGAGGAAFWLLGGYWPAFFGCAVVGVCAALAIVRIGLRAVPARIASARGLAGALEAAWRPAAVLAIAMVASFELGEHSGASHAGPLGAALAATGMLTVGGYVLAMNAVATITDGASAVLALVSPAAPPNADRDRMEAITPTARSLSRAYLVATGALAAFSLVMAFASEVSAPRSIDALGALAAAPSTFVGALAGALVIATFSALSSGAVSATAQRFAEEVRRQIASVPTFGEYRPSYRQCVDVLAKDALKRTARHAAAVVALPVAIGVLFKEGLGSGTESVAALLVTSTAVGVVLSLVAENAEAARRLAPAIAPPLKLLGTISVILAPLFL